MKRNEYGARPRREGTPLVLRAALWMALVLDGGMGLLLLLYPARVWFWSGADPIPLGVLRWPGGILLAMALGSRLVLASPKGQALWVRLMGLGHLSAGSALLFSLAAGEYTAAAAAGGVPAGVGGLMLLAAALLLLGRYNGAELLKSR